MGLTYHPLEDELLDHVCCMIEHHMHQGASYMQAESMVFEQLTSKDLKKWQEATKEIVLNRFNLMNKISFFASGMAACFILFTTVMAAQDIPSISPLTKVEITSHYGKRMHPIKKNLQMHRGIDLKASMGTPVMATADGVVHKITEDPDGYGKYIVIDHGEAVYSKYAQLSAFKVEPGQKVSKGQVIGLVGSSGASNAPHLHYEIIKNDQFVDPMDYLSFKTIIIFKNCTNFLNPRRVTFRIHLYKTLVNNFFNLTIRPAMV